MTSSVPSGLASSPEIGAQKNNTDTWPELRFYHLERMRLEAALPALLKKCLSGNLRAAVLTATPDDLEHLSKTLWLSQGFLAHGLANTPHKTMQPICLMSALDTQPPPNKATVLFQVHDTEWPEFIQQSGMKMVCDLFNGLDEAAVAAARKRWSIAKKRNQPVAYWRQDGHVWSQHT